ncbi:SdpI family protein [Aneurinibacillus tyrosinisolvens]|uniref:SdpI family protein n=1 Tax=Aneurinibacillus tyrosinisolvens TaxID=1443435 RepID=UPI00063F00E4|nr:SdpI family protein [Aneurinibacillus tyrosinisolvens]
MLLMNVGISVLIGIIFILSGLLLKYKPPRSINAIYGYRTFRSMKNTKLWREGNRYSAEIMVKYGYFFMIIGSLFSVIFKQASVTLLFIMGLMLVLIICMFVRVEKRLKQLDK